MPSAVSSESLLLTHTLLLLLLPFDSTRQTRSTSLPTHTVPALWEVGGREVQMSATLGGKLRAQTFITSSASEA